MPLRVEISHSRKFVYIVAEGAVTLREMEAHFDELVVANALGYAKLFEATELQPVYGDSDVMQMGARLSAYTATYESGPLAVVGRTEAVRDAFKRFVNISPSLSPARIFASEDKAISWLQKQPGGERVV